MSISVRIGDIIEAARSRRPGHVARMRDSGLPEAVTDGLPGG